MLVDKYIYRQIEDENSAMKLGKVMQYLFSIAWNLKALEIGFGFEIILDEYFEVRNTKHTWPYACFHP